MNETLKFFFEHLIIPALLTIFGVVLVTRIDTFAREKEKIELFSATLDKITDSKATKATALSRFIKLTSTDEKFANSYDSLILYVLKAEAEEAARNGDVENVVATGEAQKMIVENNNTISKDIVVDLTAETTTAKQLEIEGFQHIEKGELEKAALAFNKVENIVPGYHNAFEIGIALKKTIETSKQAPEKKPELTNELKKTINEKYSWKAPRKLSID